MAWGKDKDKAGEESRGHGMVSFVCQAKSTEFKLETNDVQFFENRNII